MEFISDINIALNLKKAFLAVYLDFSKAFDTVKHDILLQKLEHVGVRGVVGTWFESYLSGRQQYVSIGDAMSSTVDVVCGVPQGSVLGPLIFIIYINDMTNACTSLKGVQYADDTTLYCSSHNILLLHSIYISRQTVFLNLIFVSFG